MSEARDKIKLRFCEEINFKGDSYKIMCGIVDECFTQLEAEKAELIWMFQDLLLEAMGFYEYYPNNFRATAEEYFFEDIELLKKHGVEI